MSTQTKTETKTKLTPLLVTTLHKGVFFGYGVASDAVNIVLKDAQMCVSWSADVRGVLGLASTGPSKGCRIGPIVKEITLRDVTSVTVCTTEAADAWAAKPWS